MQIGYKLTNQNLQTHDDFQWVIGEWQEAQGNIDQDLCSSGWLHYYIDPLLVVLHNPIHANTEYPRLFEVEISGEQKHDGQLKSGCHKMRLIKEIPLPVLTQNQIIAYGIFCALEVYHESDFQNWAENWLSGNDRTARAAAQAAWAAQAARAARAAWAAAQAAWAAAQAAQAAWAARAAARAARATNKSLNLIEIAEKAMKIT